MRPQVASHSTIDTGFRRGPNLHADCWMSMQFSIPGRSYAERVSRSSATAIRRAHSRATSGCHFWLIAIRARRHYLTAGALAFHWEDPYAHLGS